MDIYVGNLSYRIDDNDLKKIFEEYGEVFSVKIIMDRDTGRSKGFGFVEMRDDNEAQMAINELNGKDVQGRPLKVNPARPKSDNRKRY